MASPNQPNREKEIFEQALDLPTLEQRRAYLQEACGEDAALLARLHGLLRAHTQAQGFLPSAPIAVGAQTAAAAVGALASGETLVSAITEKPGDQIGRYKLLEKLGDGGFGVVYMAEQREPVKRRVALKIIKVGMDTREVVARFEAERQALALMDHPNIAKVHDGGATETGRPYFVMELIRGIRITDYCDQNQLGLEERLKLFMQVCHAVQHAHQKGVIHRDLKPSNILVTLHDGPAAAGVPKVIDFGIAKATQQELTERTLFTQFHLFIGTPSYMSPEQAELSGLDIDTRSDIYSLGVLLYELLAGQPPFDGQGLLKAGLDEMRRTLREVEPPRPSTRLKRERSSQPDASRRSELGKIGNRNSELDADLDWIVMKCLEKDRGRRYETANGLATDIQRHLQNEPIAARPPSRLYQFQKMAKRNRVAFAAGAAVLVALLAGLTFSTWTLARERAARRQAASEAAKSQLVEEFHKDMIWSMRPSIAMGRDTTLLREFADRTFARLGHDLKSQPAVEIELRAALGRVFLALGDHAKAESLYQETLPRMRNLLGHEHPDVADLLHNYAEVLLGREKFNEAEAMAREALALNRRLHGQEHPNVAYSLMLVGSTLRSRAKSRGDLDQAESLLGQSLALYRKLHGPEHRDAALVLNNLAKVLQLQGRPDKAEQMYRQALAMAKSLLGDADPLVVLMTEDLAGFHFARDNFTAWETLTREVLSAQRKLLGNENRHVAKTLSVLAGGLITHGRSAEAEPLSRESLALHQRLYGNEHVEVAKNQNDLGVALLNQGRHAEAEPLLRDGLEMARKLLPPDDPIVILGIENLGIVLAAQEKYAEAEGLFREQVASARKASTNDATKLDHASSNRTNQQPAYVVVTSSNSPSTPTLDNALGNLSDALYRQKQYPEAEALYREKLQRLRVGRSPEDKAIVSTSASLGRLLADWAWAQRTNSAAADVSRLTSNSEIREIRETNTNGSLVTSTATPLQRAREGERLLRTALAAHFGRTNATPWKTSELKSRLGGALVSVVVADPELAVTDRQAKFAEAEPLLLEGNEAVQQSGSADRKYKRDALERLVHLYEAWDKPGQASAWQTKLEEFEQTEAEKNSALTKGPPR